MKTAIPLVALLFAAAAPAAADLAVTPISYHYAPADARPTMGVQIRRKFTLLEWAMLHGHDLSELDARAPQSAGRFRALSRSLDDAWIEHIVRDAPVDVATMTALASELRGADGFFRRVATEYLERSAGPRLPAAMSARLSFLETDLLEQYLPFSSQEVYGRFQSEKMALLAGIGGADEVARLPQRVPVYRSFLRAEMRRYLDAVPANGAAIDYAAEFSGVAARSRVIVSAPTSTALVSRFSDLEKSLIDSMLSPTVAELGTDEAAAAAEPARLDGLIAKWRARTLALASYHLVSAGAMPAPASARWDWEVEATGGAGAVNGPATTALERLSRFERAYLSARLRRLDASYWPRFVRAAAAADQAASRGDAAAISRFLTGVLTPMRADLRAYVDAHGASAADLQLKAWAEANLRPGGAPAAAASNAGPVAPAADPAETGRFDALRGLLGSPEEAAVADFLLDSQSQTEIATILAQAALPDGASRRALALEWRRRAVARMGQQLERPDAALSLRLQRFGLSDGALKTYYCGRLASASAAPGALGQLVTASESAPAPTARPETAAATVSFERTPAIDRLCAEPAAPVAAASPAADPASDQQPVPAPPPSRARLAPSAPPPSPFAPALSAAAPSAPGASAPQGAPGGGKVDGAAMGAGMGMLAMGVGALLLGLGPGAVLGLALFGLAYGAGLALMAQS
jgi:hypothetical protein